MKITRSICTAVVAVVLASSAYAADFGMGLRAGTNGLGADFGVGVSPWLAIRVGGSALSVSGEYDEDDIDYDGDVDLGGYGVWADFFPMKGTFRLTAGFLSNRNAVDLRAVPTAPIDIGSGIYDPAEVGTLHGDVRFDSSAPYFGIGWGNVTRGKRVGFLADIGAVWQGSGKVTLTSSTALVDPDDLAAEAAEIEDDIADLDFWPVLNVGMSIRFGPGVNRGAAPASGP